MRKIMTALIMVFMALGLIACTETNQITESYPTPEILGLEDIVFYIGDDIPDFYEGVTAKDYLDRNISSSINVLDDAVDFTTVGTYKVFYEVIDALGSKKTVYIEVYVMPTRNIEDDYPVILDAKDIVVYIGHEAPNYLKDVRAVDPKQGNITAQLTVNDHAVVLDEVGSYPLIYSITNQDNLTVTVEVTVSVEIEVIDYLNIFYINDTHGAILENGNEIGMAKIGNLILDEKAKNPNNTLFISGGDILQGNIMSNYFYGTSMIDTLNVMKHDAFVLGNHEFDWGLEVATEFFNPETTGLKANFPLLGANVFHKGTRTLPDFVDPYTIIQKGHLKVAIIGLMGYGLESSIATARVQDYEFGDPLIETQYYTEYLRTEKQVDVVIVVIHGSDEGFNQAVGQLTGDFKVDAVFNGHNHREYVRVVGRTGVDMPIIQSGANGSHVGRLRFDINSEKMITNYSAVNLNRTNETRLNWPHPTVKAVIDIYEDEISPLINEPIIYAGQSFSRSELTLYMAKLMRIKTNSDIAFHNSGGTRADISNGDPITVALLYKIFPFDNRIKTVTLQGQDVIDYIEAWGNYDMREDIGTIDPEAFYKVATNDYLFDLVSGPFIYGEDIDDTGLYIRDVLEDVLREMAKTYETFTLDRPVVVQHYRHESLLEKFIYTLSALR
jgi:2',3'-cyclic-nucleotide 2'-phosphodiesterase (5'-nucleotidase family)